MSLSQLFLQNISHVLENILGHLTVRDLARCRRVDRQWCSFIDCNRKLSRRLFWMQPDVSSLCTADGGPVRLSLTNVSSDDDIIVVDKYEDKEENDDTDDDALRNIDVYNAKNFVHIKHIGQFKDPAFHCLHKMKMVNKRLIIFTTSNYEDKLLTYDLTIPSAPEAGNFRPAGRLPLLCADADDKYDLSVYNFNPKMMNLNSLKNGLLVRRIPTGSSLVLAVKIGWPRCVAVTACEDEHQHHVQR